MSEAAKVLEDPFATSLAGRKLGRYEVLARLASGGMAGVYVARASGVAGFERLFALKVLHPHLAHEDEFISMFLDEARLAARIRHPNVVPTTDISDTPDAGYYLVMDYIEGDHLGALLQAAFKQQSRLPIPVTLRVVTDALTGLGAAHNVVDDHGRPMNLVHRDISPHNVMVSADGIARITDFGVAKSEVRLSSTRQGQFKGKLAYMAPEHASSGEADQRSDLFAMAIILWECLTGRRLFKSENHAATLNKICLEPIPAPSSVDPALAPFDDVVMRGLARSPEERFQSAEEFADALEHVAATNGGMANHRTVAKVVRSYAAEKLERDKALIRDGIALVAQSTAAEQAAAAVPTAAVAPDSGHPPPLPSTRPEAAPAQADAAQDAPNRTGMWIGLGMIALAAAIGLAVLRGDNGPTGVTSSELSAPDPGAPSGPRAEPGAEPAAEPGAKPGAKPGAPAATSAAEPAPAPGTAEATANVQPATGAAQAEADESAGAQAPAVVAEVKDGPTEAAAKAPGAPDRPAGARAAETTAAAKAARARGRGATPSQARDSRRPRPTRAAQATPPKPRPKPQPAQAKPKPSTEQDLMLNPYR